MAVHDRQERFGAKRLEHAPIPRLTEPRICLLVHHARACRLDRIEDATDAFRQRQLVEAQHGLADGVDGGAHGGGPLTQVGGETVARELARDRQRREDRRQHRRVADPPVEAQSHDRLELLDPAVRARGIERPDAFPVIGRLHRAGRTGPIAGGQHVGGLDAAPRLDAVAATGRDLEEIRAVMIVETQRRLREAGRRTVDRRKMSPHRVRHTIDGLTVDRRSQSLASRHLLHRVTRPSLSTAAPSGPTTSKPTAPSGTAWVRTVSRDGTITIPVNRAATPRTRAGSASRSRATTRDTASASVAVPCKMIAGKPAARATAPSVWMGL